jgi:hypothetical protein
MTYFERLLISLSCCEAAPLESFDIKSQPPHSAQQIYQPLMPHSTSVKHFGMNGFGGST